MNGTVVLYPPPMGPGHMIPMTQLAGLFLRHGFAPIIAVPEPPSAPGSAAAVVADLCASNPGVSFQLLPPAFCPDGEREPWSVMLDALPAAVAALRDFLRTVAADLRALVIDSFTMDAIDVAREFSIPAFLFCTNAVEYQCFQLHLPVLHSAEPKPFKDMGKTLVRVPGLPVIRASDIPVTLHDRETAWYKARLGHYMKMREADGILINSFEWLEERAVQALKDGACVPDAPTPPVYCIGPLVAAGKDGPNVLHERHECLKWLDGQPDRSVVFLCFGSMGAFSPEQTMEMARGIEGSGHRFLWVLRSPTAAHSVDDVAALLPAGFLDRTAGRGQVAGSWVPQVDVLRHAAVGAFVTHCGWNSALEAITAGVPMVCWPRYAEQRMNKVFLTEEIKVGVALEGYDEEVLPAEELGRKIRWVMESDGGKELRETAEAAKVKAALTTKEGGPSVAAFAEMVKRIMLKQ